MQVLIYCIFVEELTLQIEMYRMKKILLSSFLLFSLVGMATEEIPTPAVVLVDGLEISEDWTEYTTADGVKIEYKMTLCESEKMRAQNRLLFKFTNTTNQELTISWVTKEFRNGECWNCARLENSEYAHTLTLAPGQVLEADPTSVENNDLFIFGNFIKFVPGMTEQTLTNFEFVELSVH